MTSYAYEVEGHAVEVVRVDDGTAYARNGNAHRPTRYYRWTAKVDGRTVAVSRPTRREALEIAREYIAEEMSA